jgi:hypothetical protein
MITIDDLKTAGIAEEKATQILTDLGDVAKKFTPENVAKKAYDEVDLALLTAYKIPKLPTEMTSEYAKRIPIEVAKVQVEEKTKELNEQLKGVREELKNHPGDPKLKSQIEELLKEKENLPNQKNEWIKEWKEKAEKNESELNTFKRESELKKWIPTTFKKELDQEFIDFKVNAALKEAMAKYTKTEKDSSGNFYLIDPVNIDKVLAKEFFESKLDVLLDKGNQQQGGGANTQQRQNQNGELILDASLSDGEKIIKIKEFLGTIKKLTPMERETWEPALNELLKANSLEKYMTQKEKK